MNRDGLIRALRRYAKSNELAFSFDARRGKGSHGRVTLADNFTTIKDGDLSEIYIQVVLKQLGLSKDVLDH